VSESRNKGNTVMSHTCSPYIQNFCQDLTVLHCFQIKDGLEKTETEKFDHKRRVSQL